MHDEIEGSTFEYPSHQMEENAKSTPLYWIDKK
jgi:hypothetical protein